MARRRAVPSPARRAANIAVIAPLGRSQVPQKTSYAMRFLSSPRAARRAIARHGSPARLAPSAIGAADEDADEAAGPNEPCGWQAARAAARPVTAEPKTSQRSRLMISQRV